MFLNDSKTLFYPYLVFCLNNLIFNNIVTKKNITIIQTFNIRTEYERVKKKSKDLVAENNIDLDYTATITIWNGKNLCGLTKIHKINEHDIPDNKRRFAQSQQFVVKNRLKKCLNVKHEKIFKVAFIIDNFHIFCLFWDLRGLYQVSLSDKNVDLVQNEYDKAVELNGELSQFVKLDAFLQKISQTDYLAKFILGFVDGNHADLPTLYVITICRTEILTQIADLNRLKNTLYLIPKVVWILVENKPEKSSKLATFIEESELESIHLNTNSNLEIDLMNTGLKWLRLNYKNLNGIVLFASSQGSYDIFRLYEHIIRTKKVSVWPVGFAKKSFYQRPVCVKDKLVSWNCAGNCSKNDLIDPSSFSIHLNETYLDFILKLVDFDQIEPVKIENCTRILVWNTKTNPAVLHYKTGRNKTYNQNLLSLFVLILLNIVQQTLWYNKKRAKVKCLTLGNMDSSISQILPIPPKFKFFI
ncbi:galactosylgalactosylxylosyl 3-beta-glucuronosyltransferase 3 [Brachionus plicatilis]|uniref:Galactosylgalactosylxylosylprotein 3-beta-glucuronosyltransferase n=1 Tax=Brachionus plicatilis TaxID=10195 RepID=A0A3M7PY55_BRAPC|nr:galactosylgalactosylxylosyl 3-beta-glucuronosyltransferase 3 [Brachionus plicatilis]